MSCPELNSCCIYCLSWRVREELSIRFLCGGFSTDVAVGRQLLPQHRGVSSVSSQIIVRELSPKAHHTAQKTEREVSDKQIKRTHILGGGSSNPRLCQYTADAMGIPVYAGPVEAASIGNILVQAMASGEISSLQQLREVVRLSFAAKVYEPIKTNDWNEMYDRFLKLRRNAT
jgi:hypothetical protein